MATRSTVEVVTEDHVRAAEGEDRDAAGLADALEQRVRDGDETVTQQQIHAARETAAFARLRVDAAANRLAEYAERERLAATRRLYDEIVGAADTAGGERLAQLAQAALDALGELHGALLERNTRLAGWRTRMMHLGVPQHGNPLMPAAEHGNLGYSDSHVIAGTRRMAAAEPVATVERVVAAAGLLARGGDPGPLISDLAALDSAAPVPVGLRHFVGTGGLVFSLDREPTEVERRGIDREITEHDAWAGERPATDTQSSEAAA